MKKLILSLLFLSFCVPSFAGLQTEDSVKFKQIATPSNPAAGYNKIYFKNDDKAYKLNSAGAEVEVGPQTPWTSNIDGGGYALSNTSNIISTSNAITASGNAATVPITYKINTVTNNSAATLTITLTTTNAVDGQLSEVRILDASAVSQTITWVNTENSNGVAVPAATLGSTTLPLSVLFQYNGGTSLWRCIASS